MLEEQAQAAAVAQAQDAAAAAFYRQIDSVKQLRGGLQELQRIQAQVRQAKGRGDISQGDYLALVSEAAAKTRELTDAEALATQKKAQFIRRLKEQTAVQSLSRTELLRVKAAELGVSSAADVYIRKLDTATKSTHALGLKSAMARREIGVLIGELARGNFGALRGSGITLANRAGWIEQLMSPKGMMLGGMAGGVAAAVYGLGKAYYEGAKESEEFNKQLILTGSYAGKTTGKLNEMAKSLAGNGVTQHDAAGVLAQVVGSGAFTGQAVAMVSRTAARMQENVGQSVDETIRQFKRLQDDPVNAAKELDRTLHFLTATQLEQIRALGEQGRTADAAKIAMSAYSEEMNKRAGDVHDNLGWIEKAWNAVGDAAKWAWDRMLDIGREDTLDEKIATLQEKIARARKTPWTVSSSQTEYDQQQLNKLQEQKRQKDLLDAKAQAERTYQETQKRRNKQNAALNRDNETESQRHQREVARITAMQYADAAVRNAALERENERHKKAMARQTEKPKAYHDDEATRLLTQYHQKQAQLQGELDNSRLYSNQKLTESEKELLALENRIAVMKGKALTAADKSILAHRKALEAILETNAATEKQLRNQTALNKLQEKGVQLAQQHKQQLEQLRAKGEFDVASMGMGGKERQRAQEVFSLKQQFSSKLREINSIAEHDGTYGSPDHLALVTANATALNEQLVQMKQNYANIDAAQGDWTQGASRALDNFLTQGSNVAGMTENVFTNAFNGMTDSIANFAVTGKGSFRSLTVSILADLAKMETRIAASKLLGSVLAMFGFGTSAGGSTPSGAYSSAALSVIPNADGGVYRSAGLSQYSGSIVNRPTFFAFARGAAVMGEAGPEAILPLRRGADGKLGVVAAGSGGMAMFAPEYNIEIHNDAGNGQIGPQALQAVYNIGKKAAIDFWQQQSRDGGIAGGGR
ncbi:phage tail tape measure protein [Salmonella enterica]|nr:phage tail tape measure protein [Salmonella enterica]